MKFQVSDYDIKENLFVIILKMCLTLTNVQVYFQGNSSTIMQSTS
jgi:hypothetical protein